MTPRAGHAVRMAYVVASIAGVAFFVMSVSLLGVWPGRVLDRQVRAMSPDRPLGLTASEERGRAIYGREGCAYCHSQQIRYVHADMRRFGAPTLAWETRFDYPHLWGTRRIGPDLARAGATRADDWHYAHLFAPRSVVADSVMPSYAWLFDDAADRPTQAARDLVAYLQTLGRRVDGPEAEKAFDKEFNERLSSLALDGFNDDDVWAREAGEAFYAGDVGWVEERLYEPDLAIVEWRKLASRRNRGIQKPEHTI